MKRNVLAAALVCATAAGVLTGCGGSKDAASSSTTAAATTAAPAPTTTAPKGPLDALTAQQISDQAVTAMKALTSVHVSGQAMDSGKPVHLDVTMATSGKCLATVGESGGTAHVISTLEYTYMKGNTAFWQSQGKDGSALGSALHGRWLKIPGVAAADADLKEFCDLKSFMADITKDDGGTTTKGAPNRMDGLTVIPLSATGSDGGHVTVYVADSATPYALKMVESGGTDGGGTMTFTDFDKPLHVYAPAPADTVAESDLTL
jgi:hypothetical protein